jgi:hypothetical protein
MTSSALRFLSGTSMTISTSTFLPSLRKMAMASFSELFAMGSKIETVMAWTKCVISLTSITARPLGTWLAKLTLT